MLHYGLRIILGYLGWNNHINIPALCIIVSVLDSLLYSINKHT